MGWALGGLSGVVMMSVRFVRLLSVMMVTVWVLVRVGLVVVCSALRAAAVWFVVMVTVWLMVIIYADQEEV